MQDPGVSEETSWRFPEGVEKCRCWPERCGDGVFRAALFPSLIVANNEELWTTLVPAFSEGIGVHCLGQY